MITSAAFVFAHWFIANYYYNLSVKTLESIDAKLKKIEEKIESQKEIDVK